MIVHPWAESTSDVYYIGNKGDKLPEVITPSTLVILKDNDKFEVHHPHTQTSIEVPCSKWMKHAIAFNMSNKFIENKIVNDVMNFLKEHAPDIARCFSIQRIESSNDVKGLLK